MAQPEGAGGPVGPQSTVRQSHWEGIWRSGGKVLPPGEAFDAARSSPALTNLLASGELDVTGQRVFVPGCGRGYDVVAFAQAGAAAAVGLELAPTAAQCASEYVAAELEGQEAAARAAVYCGDFFKWQPEAGPSSFNVGYDYTFYCALHPDMRADWATAWARHMAPGGRLVALAFPIDPERGPGPPWPVQPQEYIELLEPLGFQLEKNEPVPPELSHPKRSGKEALLIFRKQGGGAAA